jgi:hypothetical protein
MQPKRLLGVTAFALATTLAAAAPTYAGGTDIGAPGVPTDSVATTQTGGTTYAAPATVQQPAGKDSGPYTAQIAPGKDGVPSTATSSAPSGVAPASVVAAPARAGGLVPGLVAAAFGGLGLLAVGGGLALRRRA